MTDKLDITCLRTLEAHAIGIGAVASARQMFSKLAKQLMIIQ